MLTVLNTTKAERNTQQNNKDNQALIVLVVLLCTEINTVLLSVENESRRIVTFGTRKLVNFGKSLYMCLVRIMVFTEHQ